jgi:hypothetical protein
MKSKGAKTLKVTAKQPQTSPKSNRAKRQAALAALAHYQGDTIIPEKTQPLRETNVDELMNTVKAEVQKRQIVGLVSSALNYRKVGVRALARKVKRSHSQIIALEQSNNMEISTLLTIANSLEFDVEVKLIPREGGRIISVALE